jgi:hypothetical protein
MIIKWKLLGEPVGEDKGKGEGDGMNMTEVHYKCSHI